MVCSVWPLKLPRLPLGPAAQEDRLLHRSICCACWLLSMSILHWPSVTCALSFHSIFLHVIPLLAMFYIVPCLSMNVHRTTIFHRKPQFSSKNGHLAKFSTYAQYRKWFSPRKVANVLVAAESAKRVGFLEKTEVVFSKKPTVLRMRGKVGPKFSVENRGSKWWKGLTSPTLGQNEYIRDVWKRWAKLLKWENIHISVKRHPSA